MDKAGQPGPESSVDIVRPVDRSAPAQSVGVVQWVPWALWSLTFVFAAASIVSAPPTNLVDAVSELGMAVGTMAVATIGALVAVRADTPNSGWLLLAFAVPWALTFAIYAMVSVLVTEGAIDLDAAQLLIGVADTAAICSMAGMFGAFLTVPDGRLPAGWGRPLALSLVILLLAWVIHTFILAGQITDPLAYVNRASLASLEGAELSRTFEAVTVLLTFIGLLAVIAVAAAMVGRYHASDLEARQQLKWALVGAMSVLFWMVLWTPQWESAAGQAVQAIAPGLGLLSLALGFGLSLFKYRLWDVDVVIRRSLVYGTLWLAIALLYAGVAAGLGLIAGSRFPVGVAIMLTVAATLLFQPARRALERVADRLVFGSRESPIAAIQEFGSSIELDSPSQDIAGALADLTRRVLGAQAVEVRIEGSEPVVVGEWADGDTVAVQVVWGRESFGSVRCLPRRGVRIGSGDVRIVEALASQAALTISNVRLASRMVTAQEAERRRIERDIHDGVQQDLAAQIGQMALARARVGSDADLAARLDSIQGEMQRTLAEIRELAQGIHPSVLRDGGLVAAIEDKCSRIPIAVTIDGLSELRNLRFADDVEAAAYFTVTEALANVIKHARASKVGIGLYRVVEELVVEVSDDGAGFDTRHVGSGTGLGGLSDRLRALGGVLDVASLPGEGTTIRARLPDARSREAR